MKYLLIAITVLSVACKGQTENKSNIAHTDSATGVTNEAITEKVESSKYRQFFDKQFSLDDSINPVYADSTDIAGNKIIVVEAFDTTYSFAKMIVFKQMGNMLTIIDSTGTMEADGRGPRFEFNNDTLVINHSVHRGNTEMRYIFNKDEEKFYLHTITVMSIPSRSISDTGDLYIYKSYNAFTRQLTLSTFLENDEEAPLVSLKKIVIAKGAVRQNLRELTDVLSFGESDVMQVDDKLIQQLLNRTR